MQGFFASLRMTILSGLQAIAEDALRFDDGAVDDFDGIEEGHGGAELRADGFDGLEGLGGADASELLAAGLVLVDEALWRSCRPGSRRAACFMAALVSAVTMRGPAM